MIEHRLKLKGKLNTSKRLNATREDADVQKQKQVIASGYNTNDNNNSVLCIKIPTVRMKRPMLVDGTLL